MYTQYTFSRALGKEFFNTSYNSVQIYQENIKSGAKIGGYGQIMGMATLSLFNDIPEVSSGWDFRTILLTHDNWERYQIEYADELRSIEIEEVNKMLACCDPEGGFVTLICLRCGEEKRIPFTCKSRLCSRCGKRYPDEWSERIGSSLYDVIPRHMVFPVPDCLWSYFEQASTLQRVLIETAASTVKR